MRGMASTACRLALHALPLRPANLHPNCPIEGHAVHAPCFDPLTQVFELGFDRHIDHLLRTA